MSEPIMTFTTLLDSVCQVLTERKVQEAAVGIALWEEIKMEFLTAELNLPNEVISLRAVVMSAVAMLLKGLTTQGNPHNHPIKDNLLTIQQCIFTLGYFTGKVA